MEQTAKENVTKGEAVPLVVDEVDKLLDDIENSEENDEEDGLREGESPDPEPRRIGCPFYFYIESKLRKKWNDRKSANANDCFIYRWIIVCIYKKDA